MDGELLFVLWGGGGNSLPALALVGRLAARGHRVRVLASDDLADEVAARGGEHVPYRDAPPFEDGPGLAFEDRPEFFAELGFGPVLAREVVAELERAPAHAVVADCLLPAALAGAEAAGAATVALVHLLLEPIRRDLVRDEGWWAEQHALLDATRSELGLPVQLTALDAWTRWDLLLALTLRELDVPAEVLANSRYVGPVLDELADAPLPRIVGSGPLVLVNLGTTWQGQGEVLERVLLALGGLDVRVLATTGPALDPAELDAATPPNVAVRRWVPHASALLHAEALVTHAGHGSVMAALAQGVPMVCIPLGRDQHRNAERVAAIRAGAVVDRHATVEELRLAMRRVLLSYAHQRGVWRFQDLIADLGQGDRAVEVLEALLERRGA